MATKKKSTKKKSATKKPPAKRKDPEPLVSMFGNHGIRGLVSPRFSNVTIDTKNCPTYTAGGSIRKVTLAKKFFPVVEIEERLISPTRARAMLGIAYPVIDRAIESGELPVFPIESEIPGTNDPRIRFMILASTLEEWRRRRYLRAQKEGSKRDQAFAETLMKPSLSPPKSLS